MHISRRDFLGAAALVPAMAATAQKRKLPVGLELFSVRDALGKDLTGTVREVAKMGYEDVEFFSPYYQWSEQQAKDMRKLLDDVGMKCFSTHNSIANYKPENVQKTIDLNNNLGVRYVVVASAGKATTLDDWKKIGETLTQGHEKLAAGKLRGGYHNHQLEFTPLEGKRPIEIIAANTPKNFVLQLDLGTCVEVGSDPVAWIKANPGRIQCMHLKEWSKEKGYKALYGEGAVPWKAVLAEAQKTGGLEYVLIEQEGSEFSEFETAKKCLALYRKMNG
jgi:sugar phosphate isomerase/epimerase